MKSKKEGTGFAAVILVITALLIIGVMFNGLFDAVMDIPYFVGVPIALIIVVCLVKVFGD